MAAIDRGAEQKQQPSDRRSTAAWRREELRLREEEIGGGVGDVQARIRCSNSSDDADGGKQQQQQCKCEV